MNDTRAKRFGKLSDTVDYNRAACTRQQASEDLAKRGCSYLSAEKLAFMLPTITAAQARKLPTLTELRRLEHLAGIHHVSPAISI